MWANAAHLHIEEIRERHTSGGADALAAMPREWWLELDANGNLDDVMDHVAALHAAGADDIAFLPAPDIDAARHDLGAVINVKSTLEPHTT